MFDTDFIFINEEFDAEHVSPQELDSLLALGWRHFGPHFYRYNLGLYEIDVRRVIPLRIRLADFSPSKSQRRTLAKNDDLNIRIILSKNAPQSADQKVFSVQAGNDNGDERKGFWQFVDRGG